ncbi:MAG: N-acetyltransferase [Elusimicrobiota bacterium]
MNIIIRRENPPERAISQEILRQTFGRETEAQLADALRQTAEFNPELSLVADRGGEILGYAMFFQASIAADAQAGTHPPQTAGLAPIAVRPQFQRQGVGERLVRHGLERCRFVGFDLVFVVGPPRYFSRFGFQPARPLGLEPAFPAGDADFQAFDLSGKFFGAVKGKISYPNPFRHAS